jgi:hypothetical protein
MSPQLRNRRCTRAMNTVWWLLGSADWLANSASKSSPIQPPSSDSVFMERFKPLKRLDLILSLSKDEDTFSGFFSFLLKVIMCGVITHFDSMTSIALFGLASHS